MASVSDMYDVTWEGKKKNTDIFLGSLRDRVVIGLPYLLVYGGCHFANVPGKRAALHFICVEKEVNELARANV